jgi:hypothetical protein
VKLIKIFLLCALSLAWADDYDEFEKSLMDESAATVATKEAVSESSEETAVVDTTKPAYTDEKFWAERAANKEKNIQKKLYTGGVGFDLYVFGAGMVLSGYEDIYRSDLLEGDVSPVHFDFYVQFSRIAVSLGYHNTALVGIESIDFTVGYVLYDSRYLKFRPFVGFSGPTSDYTVKNDFCVGSDEASEHSHCYEKGDGGGEISQEFTETGWMLGANVDLKFATTYFFSSDMTFSSFSLVGRFGVSSINLDGDVISGSGYMAFFSLGLGFYLW